MVSLTLKQCSGLFFLLSCAVIVAKDASLGVSTMPRDQYSIAIGYDETSDFIWLVGDNSGLISFDRSKWDENEPFIDYGETILSPYRIYAYGQSYVQKDNILYCNYGTYNQLMKFDLESNELTELGYGHTSSWGCFGIIDNYLLYTWKDIVNVFNIETEIWTSTDTTIIEPRQGHTCMVQPLTGYFYIIGGAYNGQYFDSIEKLFVGDIENIDNYVWKQLDDTLTHAAAEIRSIIAAEFIYVMGGTLGSCTCDTRSNAIDIIDTITNAILHISDTLYEGILGMTPIVVGERVYIFGGYNGNMVDYWQYYEINNYECDSCTDVHDAVCCNGIEYVNACAAFCLCNDTYVYNCITNDTDFDVLFECKDDLDCNNLEFCSNERLCEVMPTTTKNDESDGVTAIFVTVIVIVLVICMLYFVLRYQKKRRRIAMERTVLARAAREIVHKKVKRLDDAPIKPSMNETMTQPRNYHIGRDKRNTNIEMIDKQATQSYSAMNCVICLDVLLDHEASKLVCGHRFHTHCIEEYNETKSKCPLCRQTIVFK